MMEVVAALIWGGEKEKFLACQRPPHKARGLTWEFVGGKVEPGETLAEALVRECREELAVTLAVGKPLMDVVHEYPDVTVHLTLLEATVAEGEPRALEHHDIRWMTLKEAADYPFSPADQSFLERLRCV
ncbi:MAG: (deoxy)nucleoside triphosphate pyrophosphohydrolase [Oscillibacter sp.]|nr:(deoxy)nucleoside triphosphate pyrophosphohydrolase [Oscillibacter sp.]